MTTYTAEETAANRAKWVVALRSGEYVQGRALLRSADDRFCCLGVACELAALEGAVPGFDHDSYAGSTALLPLPVVDWLGLSSTYGDLVNEIPWADSPAAPRSAAALTELNDNLGWTFDQIADLIEAGGVKLGDPT